MCMRLRTHRYESPVVMAILEEEQTLNRERCKRKTEEKRSKEEEGGKGKSNFFGVSRGSSACVCIPQFSVQWRERITVFFVGPSFILFMLHFTKRVECFHLITRLPSMRLILS